MIARMACVVLGLLLSAAAQGTEVIAEGLLPGMAVLIIDGERVTLRPGQERGSVQLIDVSADRAVLDVDGQRRELRISGRVDSNFVAPEERSVTIRRNARLQYVTTAEINGRRMRVLVDTGANMVAMNARHARSLGIAEDEGRLGSVSTASDVRAARLVTLRSVNVGGIEAQAVDATVLDGEQPQLILLGMSFLQHVQLEEREGVLTLRRRW